MLFPEYHQNKYNLQPINLKKMLGVCYWILRG